MKNEYYITAGVAGILMSFFLFMFASPYIPLTHIENTINLANTIRAAKTTQDLYARFSRATQGSQQIKVLIVPGHEPSTGGTEYKNITERDIVVDIADELATRLRANPAFTVMVARTKTAWDPTLKTYVSAHQQEIIAWRDSNKVDTAKRIANGEIQTVVPTVHHNPAPADTSLWLNGINKWADENDYDLVLHLHINDYPRAYMSEPGEYTGLTIYIPHSHYANSAASREVAKPILARLARYNPTSNLPGEMGGIVEDAELIAIGRDNSQSAASLLIEYGYIYEPQFTHESLRTVTVRDLAEQTYLGLQDFFTGTTHTEFSSTVLPYFWQESFESGAENSLDVFALQTALLEDGDYPPSGTTLNECSRSGTFGPCTERALQLFQQKYGIEGDGTVVGPATRTQLNALYGNKLGYQ